MEAREAVHCKRGFCERTVRAQQANTELSHYLACSTELVVVGQRSRPALEDRGRQKQEEIE